jgi:uncharacterized protein YndB with AHSA1/START domain
MATIKQGLIEHEMDIQAPPQVVFAYFTQADKMVLWKGQEATLDPQPGGLYRVSFADGNIVRGEFRLVQPYTRIVFTWGWEDDQQVPPGSSTVEVQFISIEQGTRVIVRHSGLPIAFLLKHSEGWMLFGNNLLAALNTA